MKEFLEECLQLHDTVRAFREYTQASAEKLRQRCRDEMFAYETDDVPKSYKPPGSLA